MRQLRQNGTTLSLFHSAHDMGKETEKTSPRSLVGGRNPALDAEERQGRTAFKRARDLRKNPTDAETKLWMAVRRKQIGRLRFRRQFILGPYFADFVCLPARLVVEVDGRQHFDEAQREHDRRRTAWLEREGFKVLRFLNYDVLKNLEGVIRVISEIAMERAAKRSRERSGCSPADRA